MKHEFSANWVVMNHNEKCMHLSPLQKLYVSPIAKKGE